MHKIKTLLFSAILLFGFGQSVLASDFTIPTTSSGGEIGFIGKFSQLDFTKFNIIENSFGNPLSGDVVYSIFSIQEKECANNAEDYFNNIFVDAGGADYGRIVADNQSFKMNDNVSFTNITPIGPYPAFNPLCRYQIYIDLASAGWANRFYAYRYFDFASEVTLPSTVMLSPTSTVSYIMTPVISQITNLTRDILSQWWIYILLFGVVGIFMIKFKDLIAIFTGNRKNPTGYNKEINALYHRNKSIRRWHKKSMTRKRSKYGFESYKK